MPLSAGTADLPKRGEHPFTSQMFKLAATLRPKGRPFGRVILMAESRRRGGANLPKEPKPRAKRLGDGGDARGGPPLPPVLEGGEHGDRQPVPVLAGLSDDLRLREAPIGSRRPGKVAEELVDEGFGSGHAGDVTSCSNNDASALFVDARTFVGTKIRALRMEQGLSLDKLGQKMTELGAPTYKGILSKIERGLVYFNAKQLFAAAAALEVQPSELLPGIDPPPDALRLPGARDLLDAYARGGTAAVIRWAAQRLP